MAQLRFIGLTEDLTQEVHLLMLQALTQPKIVAGMNVSIQSNSGSLYLSISPGKFILPDGMVVEETARLSIPLVPPTTSQDYEVTLIAYRSTNPGIMNDEVFYQIINGTHYSSTIGNVIATTNKVFMPLTWIGYSVSEDSFSITDLGDRASDNATLLKAPFENITSDSSAVTNNVLTEKIKSADSYIIETPDASSFSEDLGVYNLTNSSPMQRTASAPDTGEYAVDSGTYTFSSSDDTDMVRISYVTGQGKSYRMIDNDLVDSLRTGSTFYFRIPKDPNNLISSIYFEGKSELGTSQSQTVSVRSLYNLDDRLNKTYNFISTSFDIKIFNYPTNIRMNEDLLEITVTGGNTFYLKTVTINKTRIF